MISIFGPCFSYQGVFCHNKMDTPLWVTEN